MIQATRVHTPDGRYYQIGDEQYPSVTTILSAISKPALSRWIEQQTITQTIAAADAVYRSTLTQPPLSATTFATAVQARLKMQPGKSRTLAMNIGTEAHALIEWRLRAMLGQHGPRPTVSDPAETAYAAWESWAIQHDLEPIWIEETVWSSRYRYAGTMDLLCKLDGQLTLIDWKTGKAVYPEAFLQNVAYQRAYNEMGHEPVTQGRIVRLPKTADDCVEVIPVPIGVDEFEIFLAIRAVFEWQRRQK